MLRVDSLKDGLLDEMKSAGCFLVLYGFESYNPAVLKSMKKNITPQQIHHALHAALDRGLSIGGNFIFGDRAETLQTAKETLDFWKNHSEAGIKLDFMKIYPQSELYQYAVKKGLIKDRLDFIANHSLVDVLNLTDMPDADHFKLKTLVVKYRIKYSPYSIPIRLTDSSITIRCPHCKKVTEYKNFSALFLKGLLNSQAFHCRKCRKKFYSLNRLYLFRPKSEFLFKRSIGRAYYGLHKLVIFLFTERFLVLAVTRIGLIYYFMKLFLKKYIFPGGRR
jgi:radical SAM superfamily enzyme YgiQ (UPF0313 family)